MKVKVLLYSGQQANQSCDLTAVERFAGRHWMQELTHIEVVVLLVNCVYLRTICMHKPLVMILVVSLSQFWDALLVVAYITRSASTRLIWQMRSSRCCNLSCLCGQAQAWQ